MVPGSRGDGCYRRNVGVNRSTGLRSFGSGVVAGVAQVDERDELLELLEAEDRLCLLRLEECRGAPVGGESARVPGEQDDRRQRRPSPAGLPGFW